MSRSCVHSCLAAGGPNHFISLPRLQVSHDFAINFNPEDDECEGKERPVDFNECVCERVCVFDRCCQAVDGQLYPCPRSLAPPLLIRDPRSGGGLPELPS